MTRYFKALAAAITAGLGSAMAAVESSGWTQGEIITVIAAVLIAGGTTLGGAEHRFRRPLAAHPAAASRAGQVPQPQVTPAHLFRRSANHESRILCRRSRIASRGR